MKRFYRIKRLGANWERGEFANRESNNTPQLVLTVQPYNGKDERPISQSRSGACGRQRVDAAWAKFGG